MVLCLAATVVPCAAQAVEYSALPSVTLEETYSDNIRLSRELQETATATILTPRLSLAARTATWQLGTDLRWRAARYHGIEGLDADDRTANLFSQIQTERNGLQIGASKSRDSILDSETLDADTGLVTAQAFRITDSATASWIWSITEKDQFKLGYQYADVAYKDSRDSTVTGLRDYTQNGPTASLTHQLSERSRVSLLAGSSLFNIPELNSSNIGVNIPAYADGVNLLVPIPNPNVLKYESRTNNLQAGIDYKFSETLSGSLSVGKRKTDSKGVTEYCTSTDQPPFGVILPPGTYPAHCLTANIVNETNETRGSVYSGNFTKSFAASNLTGRVERAVDPSGSGALIQRDTLNLGMDWSRTERLIFLLSARGDKIRAIEGDTVSVDRNQYFVQPGLQWRLAQDSRLTLAYQYKYLWYLSATEAAKANNVTLSFNHAWRRRSVSR